MGHWGQEQGRLRVKPCTPQTHQGGSLNYQTSPSFVQCTANLFLGYAEPGWLRREEAWAGAWRPHLAPPRGRASSLGRPGCRGPRGARLSLWRSGRGRNPRPAWRRTLGALRGAPAACPARSLSKCASVRARIARLRPTSPGWTQIHETDNQAMGPRSTHARAPAAAAWNRRLLRSRVRAAAERRMCPARAGSNNQDNGDVVMQF